jgi:retron-type reverse transcriptase
VAPPFERVWIAKDDGKKRPLGNPCFEDQSGQRAGVMILEASCAQDFHAFSHGFRKGHRLQQALHDRREQWRTLPINGIVDAEGSGFCDNLDGSHLREFIQQRGSEGRILRLMGQGRHAGVLEAGALMHPDKGTPHGGVLAPMVAHVFLHQGLDDWLLKDVPPGCRVAVF